MENRKTLKEVLKDLSKSYGKEVMLDMDDKDTGKIEAISTGCYSLDHVFGCGGLPAGRIVEIHGQPSGGKSTLAMFLVSVIQRIGKKVAWLDAEFAWSQKYAEELGIKIKDLLLFQPQSAEQAMDIIQKLIESGEVSLIVIDSTAALCPEAELEGEIRDQQVALQARILSKGLRMMTGLASRTKTTILFISQMRSKIGYFVGSSETTSGGKALLFYSSIRLKVDKEKSYKGKNEEVIGNRLKIVAEKNKVGIPFRSCSVDLIFSKGIDVIADIFDVAVEHGIIQKDGNTHTYIKEKLGVGRDSSIEFLKINELIYTKIFEQVMLIGEDKDEKEKKEKK
jgi:recombination protein RecA